MTKDWSDRFVHGSVTADGNHINWENGTYWTRAEIYRPRNTGQ